MEGIINIYKEKGFTSHDVVAKLRGILKTRKIGHTGTLDPDAVGVLPVCVGKATSLCEYLTNKEKEYEAVIHLGIVTNTLDMSGTILEENDVKVTLDDVNTVLQKFVGDIMQIPPMYSAIKINGKKLYEIARKGMEVERTPRPVHIEYIEIVSFDETDKTVRIRTKVSKGTYIRSLCDDIGRELGCGACMGELIRTKSGVFDIENALTLTEIEELRNDNQLDEYVVPIYNMFKMPGIVVLPEYEKRVLNGNDIAVSMVKEYAIEENSYQYIVTGDDDVCVYLRDGSFVAIYRFDKTKAMYKPVKMFL